MQVRAEFDADAMVRALEEQRQRVGAGWMGVAEQITAQSSELRARMNDHAVCGGALTRTVHRQTMTCQYALMLLRWLGRPPEDFLTGAAAAVGDTRLPEAGPDQRLLFDLHALWQVLDRRRSEEQRSLVDIADDLGCTPSRLTNLRTARQADMHLVIRITQLLGLPATRFVRAVDH